MDMVSRFNELMHGFIPEAITYEWLLANREGTLENGGSVCHYKLKQVDGQWLLGAYGISRFTNSRYYEITESGELHYKWSANDMYFPQDPGSLDEVVNSNRIGEHRIRLFGLAEDDDERLPE